MWIQLLKRPKTALITKTTKKQDLSTKDVTYFWEIRVLFNRVLWRGG